MLRKRTIDELDDATTLASTGGHVPLYETQYPRDFAPRLRTLFERMQRRGQEPLFPSSWQLDFMNLPSVLFMSPSSDQAYAPIRALSSRSSSEFRGKLAMEKLLSLGRDVRNHSADAKNHDVRRRRASYKVEAIVMATVKRYMNWTLTDGNLEPDVFESRLILSSLGRKGDSVNDKDAIDGLTDKTTSRLRKLANSHREAATRLGKRHKKGFMTSLLKSARGGGGGGGGGSDEECEGRDAMRYERAMSRTIYGLAIYCARVVIVALNVGDASFPIRTLGALDFSDARQDLWSVLAIMLTIHAAREECLDSSGDAMQTSIDEKNLQVRFSSMFVDTTGDKDL